MTDDNGTEPPRAPSQGPKLAELVGRLFADLETLLVQELALLRVETGETLGTMLGSGLLLLGGFAVACVGGGAMIAALIMLLGMVLPMWMAAALVGALAIASGVGLALVARRRLMRATFLPERTLRSLRAAGAWARDELT